MNNKHEQKNATKKTTKASKTKAPLAGDVFIEWAESTADFAKRFRETESREPDNELAKMSGAYLGMLAFAIGSRIGGDDAALSTLFRRLARVAQAGITASTSNGEAPPTPAERFDMGLSILHDVAAALQEEPLPADARTPANQLCRGLALFVEMIQKALDEVSQRPGSNVDDLFQVVLGGLEGMQTGKTRALVDATKRAA